MTLVDAEKARRAGQYKKAIALYRQTIEREPDNPEAYAGLSLCLFCSNKHDDAFSSAQRAIAIDNNSALAHLALAYIFHQRGQQEKFKEEVSNAFSRQPFVYEVACAYGLLLLNDKKIDQSLPVFEQLIAADQTKPCPHYYLGVVYSQKKKHRVALAEFRRAFQIQPSLGKAWSMVKTVVALYPAILFVMLFALIALFVLYPPSMLFFLSLLFLTFFIEILVVSYQKIRFGQYKLGIVYLALLILISWMVYYSSYGQSK